MKKWIFLGIGILLMFGPIVLGLSAMLQMLGVFIGAIELWITRPIEIGSILCLVALCLLPGLTPAVVFTAAFGNSTIMFLVFSCLLTYGLSATGVLRKLALFFINNPISKRSVWHFLGMYLLSMLILGSFIAPTTLFILYFGIAKEIYSLLKLEQGDKLARNMMIGTGFFASISCAMTPIAHTFPIMALGYYSAATGIAIPYLTYMAFSVPIGIILAVIAFALLCKGLTNNYNLQAVTLTADGWTPKAKFSLGVFIAVVIMWLIVGIWPAAFAGLNALSTAWPAMLGCAALAIADCFSFKDGFAKGVPWSAITLCGATLALGSALKMEQFGIISAISAWLAPIMSTISPLIIIAILTVVLTNLISNIVTTTVSYNLIVPTLITTGLFNPATATILIGIGASLAYALPSSIAHIALAGSSGWATSSDMLKYGSIMVLVSVLTILLIGVII